jgi:hypothetical protein
MPYQQLYDTWNQINDPRFQSQQLGQRIHTATPQLQDLLSQLYGGMASRGLFSTGPVVTAGANATGRFASGITQDYFSGLDQQKMQLLQLITELQQQEEARKAQQKSSLWSGLGGLLGTGLGFLAGGPIGGAIGMNYGNPYKLLTGGGNG